ncbi:Type I restriction enzyme R protein N-terminal domain-containing protein [Nostoc sp. DSM 114160]|jgi:hypothetical protein
MPYSQFNIDRVKQDFHLNTIEGVRFFPDSIEPITPSFRLQGILEDLPWAIAVDTEKARSEAIINPILLEVRRIFNSTISVFSGEEFNVDPSIGLNGVCDFLLCRSPEQLTVEAPAIVIVEAKKSDLKSGLGTMHCRNGSCTAIQPSQRTTFNSSLRYCKQWNPMAISETRGTNSHN